MIARAAQPVSDRTHWVPLPEAARLLGVSEGNLRRTCKQIEPKGLACKRVIGGKKTWHIAASHSPRLVRQNVEQTEQGTSIVNELLRHVSAEKRKEAGVKFQVLKAFRAAKCGSGFNFASFRERMRELHGWCPGRARLYEIHAQCPPSSDAAGCIAALVDTRGRPAGEIESVSDAAWQQFSKFYLTSQLWSISKCYRATAELATENEWAWPSYRTITRLVEERIDPAMACLKREGRDAWQKKFAAPMEQDPDAWAAGQCWEGDHSVLDFEVRVIRGDGWARTRPQLTAWQDRRTRRLMGWVISEQGNSLRIREALLNGLQQPDVSAPEVVWIDNGKDFMAQSLGGVTKQARRKLTGPEQREAESAATGILNMLGIEPHFANAYNHNGKARIERLFGKVHGDFCNEFKSYIGNRPGMVDRRAMAAETRDVMNLPTIEEVRERFAAWAEYHNHSADHSIEALCDPESRERLSPQEFYDRYLPTKRTVDRDALTLLAPVWTNPLKVSKHGISVRMGGRTVRYGELEPQLELLAGTDRRVFVSYDPDDTGSVRVWDEQFRFLCTALENGRYGGLTDDKVKLADRRAAHNERRAQLRRVRERVKVDKLTLSDAEAASAAAREREVGETKARIREHDRDRDPNDIPNLRLVSTRLEGQADEVKKAEQRKAAGAEQDDMPSLIDAVAQKYLKPNRDPSQAMPSLLERRPFGHAQQHMNEEMPSLLDRRATQIGPKAEPDYHITDAHR